MCNISGRKRDRTSQQPFRLEKGVLSQNKNVHAGEYINHSKLTASLTDKQRHRDRFDCAFYSSTCLERQKLIEQLKERR